MPDPNRSAPDRGARCGLRGQIAAQASGQLSVAPHQNGWAVMHGTGFLGSMRRREDAVATLKALTAER